MAYKDVNHLGRADGEIQTDNAQILQANAPSLDLPHDSYVRDAEMSRDGSDLILNSPDGTIVVESYFSGAQSPALVAPSGATLSPELVNSFITSGNQYVQNASMNDVSPIGAVQEINGNASITRGDGTNEELSIGSPVYQGDVIETDAGAAVNITFVDESSFAVSEETRLAIDEYVFDPASQGGVQNFSVLKGVFVYTSGLIGREDPDDVSIETPVGSIGIRGTIIAGDVDQGEITVVEGAIVLRDISGNEMTLASQFETGRFAGSNGIENLGQKSANDVVEKFSIVSNVAPNMFSSINDAAAESGQENIQQEADLIQESPAQETMKEPVFDADGATDQNNDSEVDGTVDDSMNMDTSEEGKTLEGASLEAPLNKQSDIAQEMPVDAQNMNPMAMKIAHAMGMMDITNTSSLTEMAGSGNMMNISMTQSGAMQPLADGSAMPTKSSTIRIQNSEIGDLLIDPNVLQTRPLTRTNSGSSPTIFRETATNALNYASIAPDDFFASGEGYAWQYTFAPEFDASATSYNLSAATHSTLNALESQGIIKTGGVSFINTNGRLILDFANDFAGTIADNTAQTISIEVSATNQFGTSSFTNFDFDIYNDAASPIIEWAAPNEISGTSAVYNSPVGINSPLTDIGGTTASDDIKVFFGDGNDVTNIGSSNSVTNSVINLGSGNNTVTTFAGTASTDNTIIGGNQTDTFVIGEVENKFYGMGGDDIFKIDVSNSVAGTDAISKLNINGSDILIDGGTSGFRTQNTLKNGSQSLGGRGDTLKLSDTGAIDFTAINGSFIKGIERLELGAGNQTVTLGYEDVIQMTDGRNILVIRADANDNITFDGFAGRGFDDKGVQMFDDTAGNGTAATGDDTAFNVYSNGDVTLLVEAGAGGDAATAIAI